MKKMLHKKGSLTEFLPAALEVQQKPPHPLSRITAYTLILLFLFLVFWSVIGHVNVVAIAQGQIIPARRVKNIQSAVDAQLSNVFIGEDQQVKKGDVLLQFDQTQITAQLSQLQLQYERQAELLQRREILLTWHDYLESAFADHPLSIPDVQWRYSQSVSKQQKDLLQSEFSDFHYRLQAQFQAWQKSLRQAQAAQALIEQHQRSLPIEKKRREAAKLLFSKGLLAEFDFLAIKRAVIELEQQLQFQQSQKHLAEAEALQSLRLMNAMQAEYKAKTREEIVNLKNKQQQLSQKILALNQERQKYTLLAPVNGVVKELIPHHQGTVVKQGQQLLSLVPSDEPLLVEAILPNKDIAYVQEGMPAEVKVESIPFTRYGLVPARIVSIANDATEDPQLGLVYNIKLALDKKAMQIKGRQVALMPGMAVTAELKTGSRRLIEFFMAPLLQTSHESLRER